MKTLAITLSLFAGAAQAWPVWMTNYNASDDYIDAYGNVIEGHLSFKPTVNGPGDWEPVSVLSEYEYGPIVLVDESGTRHPVGDLRASAYTPHLRIWEGSRDPDSLYIREGFDWDRFWIEHKGRRVTRYMVNYHSKIGNPYISVDFILPRNPENDKRWLPVTISLENLLVIPEDYDLNWKDQWIDGAPEETSAIPVPAAAWLFASGLLGLVGVARR